MCAHADENPASAQTPLNRLDAMSQPWGLQHLEVFILKLVSTTDSYLCVLKEPWRAKQPPIHRVSKPLSCLGFLMFVKYGRGVVGHYGVENDFPR